MTEIKDRLHELEEQIGIKTSNLRQQNKELNQNIQGEHKRIISDINMYNKIKKEGMLTMNDIQAMNRDSKLIVNQENYNYIIWSLLALGAITLTIGRLNK
jgi:SMC interacting uncharacterized protein involved in chromosome segregation